MKPPLSRSRSHRNDQKTLLPNKKRPGHILTGILLLFILSACEVPRTLGILPIQPLDISPTITAGPPPEVVGPLEGAITNWYVAADGSDDSGNTCEFESSPCQTVGKALAWLRYFDPNGRNRHVVHVAAGTYMDASSFQELHGEITISGAGAGTTIIDRTVENSEGEDVIRQGFWINSPGRVVIEDLTLRNARECVRMRNTSTGPILLNNVNLVGCVGNGISNHGRGPVDLINVNIRETHDAGIQFPDTNLWEHGIFNAGTINMEGGEIADNANSGIYNLGSLSLIGTAIRSNDFEGLDHQAGSALLSFVSITEHHGPRPVYGINILGTLSIDNGRIQENDRGVHVGPGGCLTMADSILRDHPGTALSIVDTGTAVLDRVTIENNGTLGPRNWAINNAGDLTLEHSELLRNFDGAIRNAATGTVDMRFTNVLYTTAYTSEAYPTINDYGGVVSITNSLIAHNRLEGGSAAIEASGELLVLNSTISNNSGLGLNVYGLVTISHATIAENGSYGILSSGATIDNTLIARNSPRDCINTFSQNGSTTSGVNIDTDGSCGVEATYAPTALLLGPLADYGGPTMTHALLPDSPAIDAAVGNCPPVDQRDFGRPVGAACDVGAYETGAVAPEAEESEEEEGSGGATTVTVLIPETPCYTGPGQEWDLINNFPEGTTLALVGAGFTGNGNTDWVVGSHPTVENTNCWLPGDKVNSGIPLGEMRLITVPPLPTPLPTATPDEVRQPAEPTPCPLNGNGIPKC